MYASGIEVLSILLMLKISEKMFSYCCFRFSSFLLRVFFEVEGMVFTLESEDVSILG